MSGMGPVQDWQDEEALGRLYEKIEGLGFIPAQISYANIDELKPHLTLEDLQCVGPCSFVKTMTSYAARVIQYAGALRSLKMGTINEKIEKSEQLTNEQKLYALATHSFNNETEFHALLKESIKRQQDVDALLKELHKRQQHVKHSTLHKVSEILDYFTYL